MLLQVSGQGNGGAMLPGWVEKTSRKSGKTYWYNSITKQTSWSFPAASTDTLTNTTNGAPPPARAMDGGSRREAPGAPAAIVAPQHPSGRPQGRPPTQTPAAGVAEPTAMQHASRVQEQTTTIQRKTNAPRVVQPQWIERVSRSKGKTYFQNIVTGGRTDQPTDLPVR